MKKFLLLLVLILIMSAGFTAQALNLESFRHQATYVIDDDLDDAINGTDVYRVDGARIFTNLSNLSSGYEQLMGNISDDEFVIGYVSPEFMGMKSSMFWGTGKSVTPEYLNILIGEGRMGNGFISVEDINRYDTNNDGTLDYEEYRYKEKEGEYADLESDILLNLAKNMGKSVLSFTYRRISDKYTHDYNDSLYNQELDLSYTPDRLEYYYRADTTMDYGNHNPGNLFDLAYEMPFAGWKLRTDIFVNMYTDESMDDEISHYFADWQPSVDTLTNTRLDSANMDYLDKYGNNLYGAAFRLSDKNNGIYWETHARVSMRTGSGDYERQSYTYSHQNYMIGGNVADYMATTDSSVTAPISVSGLNYGFGGRMEWNISENVVIGLGARFSSTTFNRDYDETYELDSRIEFDDGDNQADDPDDYVTTTTGGFEATREIESVYHTWEVPAGVEINIGKNKDWFVRMGALATKRNHSYLETFNVDDYERRITTTITDAPDTTITYEDVEYTSWKEDTYDEDQWVSFAYGLGWKPSKNLSIDLLGMFNFDNYENTELISTDWIRSLRLSATVSF